MRTEQGRRKAVAQIAQEANELPTTANEAPTLRLFLRHTPLVPDCSLHRQRALLLARRGAALARVGGRDTEAAEAVRQAVAITAGIVWKDRPFPVPPVSPVSSSAFLPTLLWPPDSGQLYDMACYLALASTLPRAN